MNEANFKIEDAGELYVEESFSSVDDFMNKWLIGFGVAHELATILSIHFDEVIKIISTYLKSKYLASFNVKHHNYYLVCRRLEK